MSWFYWGSVCLAIAVTLYLTDRRRWLTGHFLIVAVASLGIAGYQQLTGKASAYWQAILLSLKILISILGPLLLIAIGVAFVRYSWQLMKREGRHFQYALLGVVGVGVLATLIVTALDLTIWRHPHLGFWLGWAWLLIGFFAGSFLAYLVALLLNRRWRVPQLDYLIVLGAGLLADGRPTRSLRYRLRKAALEYQHQLNTYHQRPTLIVSGGQGADEVMAESTAMRRYLASIGIPAAVIMEENRATNTWENLRFSAELILQEKPFYRAAFVTSNYHVLRGNLMCRRLQLPIFGLGAATPWYYWPFAAFREYLALIIMNRWVNFWAVIVLSVCYLWLQKGSI